MKTIIAVLHAGNETSTKETISRLSSKLPIIVVNNGAHYYNDRDDVKICDLTENHYFVGGWNIFMQKYLSVLQYEYGGIDAVWMLNNDIVGLDDDKLKAVEDQAEKSWGKSIAGWSPTFNSPHPSFHYVKGNIKRDSKWLDWCCPLIRVQAWEDVGPFDNKFVGYGADLDWCYRARDYYNRFEIINVEKIHHLGSIATNTLQTGNKMQLGWEEYLYEKWKIKNWIELTY